MRVRVLGVVIAVGAAVVLGGCASTVNGQPSAAAKATFPSTNAAPGPALAARMYDAMTQATSLHAVAHAVNPDGSKVSFDIHYGQYTTQGTVIEQGVTLAVLSVPGAVYFKADDTFWKNLLPANKLATLLPKLRGKWVAGPPGDPNYTALADSVSRESLLGSLTKDPHDSSFTIIGSGTRLGIAVTRLHDSTDGSEVDVPAHGDPLPIYVATPQTPGNPSGTVVFSDWNVPFDAPNPPPSEVVDLSTYLH